MLRSLVAGVALAVTLIAAAPASADTPIVVLTSASNPFSSYTGEILRAEGFNGFGSADVSQIDAGVLRGYDVAVLGDVPVSDSQAAALSAWVAGGGNLIALGPDPKLAGLLGIAPTGTALADAYLRVDSGSPPGAGIVGQTIQYHGSADRYALAGARAVATLYSDASTATANPAVTLRSVGAGQAAAFAFDLARSVSLTRQGNPAATGLERDGFNPIRTNDLFYPGWVDLEKIHIPQADEAQRLLANLITTMSNLPVPRLWYLPRGERAAVVMTGDDHNEGGTAGRFDQHKAASRPGCSVARWECVRSTSYIYADTPVANAAGYVSEGFEIALHPHDGGCENFVASPYEDLTEVYDERLAGWTQFKPELPAPVTSRFHCVSWPDWSTHAVVEAEHGIRLDTNYYHYPEAWGGSPGFMTGSGEIMRFADAAGRPIGVYQAHTHVNDEAMDEELGQVSAAIVYLLDAATGPSGFYGLFTMNMHTDRAESAGADAIVAAAQARDVPVITARQALAWVEGRDASSFGSFAWSGTRLGFSVAVAPGAEGLSGMLPAQSPAGGPLTSLTRDGVPVPVTGQTIKGVPYGFFDADSGRYEAQYGAPPTVAPPSGCRCGTPSAGGSGGPSQAKLRLARRMRLGKVLRRGLVFRVRCAQRCRVRTRLTTGRGRRARVVGRGSRRLPAGRTARVVVKILPKAARRLRRLERVRLTVRITLSDAAGKPRTIVRRVVLVR
jgi:hypothetical protein